MMQKDKIAVELEPLVEDVRKMVQRSDLAAVANR